MVRSQRRRRAPRFTPASRLVRVRFDGARFSFILRCSAAGLSAGTATVIPTAGARSGSSCGGSPAIGGRLRRPPSPLSDASIFRHIRERSPFRTSVLSGRAVLIRRDLPAREDTLFVEALSLISSFRELSPFASDATARCGPGFHRAAIVRRLRMRVDRHLLFVQGRTTDSSVPTRESFCGPR